MKVNVPATVLLPYSNVNRVTIEDVEAAIVTKWIMMRIGLELYLYNSFFSAPPALSLTYCKLGLLTLVSLEYTNCSFNTILPGVVWISLLATVLDLVCLDECGSRL